MPEEPNTYWRITRFITLLLMLLGFATTFCTMFFARELAGVTLFGWSFPFYMAAQGLILLYVLIVAAYALIMRHLDNKFRSESIDGQ